MRWGYLFLAAISAGILVAAPHDVWSGVAAVASVLHFGLFLDGCLERHRP